MIKDGLVPIVMESTMILSLILLSRFAAFALIPETSPYQHRSRNNNKSRRVPFALQAISGHRENDQEDDNIASFRDKLELLYDSKESCSQFETIDSEFDPLNNSRWADECADENEVSSLMSVMFFFLNMEINVLNEFHVEKNDIKILCLVFSINR